MQHSPYYRRLGMTVLSFIAMYILIYAMLNSLANVLNNINQVYMAGLTAAPMVLIELLLMGSMQVGIAIRGPAALAMRTANRDGCFSRCVAAPPARLTTMIALAHHGLACARPPKRGAGAKLQADPPKRKIALTESSGHR